MRIIIGSGVALLLGGALVWALRPEPLAVDLAQATRAPLEVRLSTEGMTRVREPYVITSPISGTTTRAPVQVGDAVVQGETVVAVIQPASPELMDARTRAQAEAAVAEAEAAINVAEANITRATLALEHAQSQYARGEGLARAGTIPQRMLDDLRAELEQARQALTSAEAERSLSMASLTRARAQLVGPDALDLPGGTAGECCVQLRAPLTGTVLDIPDRNARQVTAGMALMTIGDLRDLEIRVDLLSNDALRLRPGTSARVTRWGGADDLDAVVRRIEPAAFTRVSALGIEEQRVHVLLDMLSAPEDFEGLGEQFRVHVDLILWQSDDALQIPLGALFRQGDSWAVFRADAQGEVARVTVVPGQRGVEHVEILEGLDEGDPVVLFPPNALRDGVRVVPRDNARL